MQHDGLPVRPDLDQIKRQAKELLRAARDGDRAARSLIATFHPRPPAFEGLKLADAQLALARSYEAASWPRLVQACELAAAIWANDVDAVRVLVTANPFLLHERVLIRKSSNWGPPMSYAANLGRDAIIHMLHSLGARDLELAAGRAALQGQVATARLIYDLAGRPPVPTGALGGPAYTLSESGTALLLSLGAAVRDAQGKSVAPVDVVLETDSRKPTSKHAILELYAQYGVELPDTPTMALHRGRIDLLEALMARDPTMVTRTYTHDEIYPPELGCHDEVQATQGTPLKGSTLLHLCADYDEFEIAQWLLARGANVNAAAEVDSDGFGGHTPIFCTVVSQPAFWMNYGHHALSSRFTQLFLEHGADVKVRASLRKQLHPGYGDHPLREYRDVTPRSWGERFEEKLFVNGAALSLITEAGGQV